MVLVQFFLGRILCSVGKLCFAMVIAVVIII